MSNLKFHENQRQKYFWHRRKIGKFQIYLEVTEGQGPYSSYQIIIKIGLKIDFDLVSDGPRPLQISAGLTAKQSNVGGGGDGGDGPSQIF